MFAVMTPEMQIILQLASLGIGGVVASIVLLKTIPEKDRQHCDLVKAMNAEHTRIVEKLVEDCRGERNEVRKEAVEKIRQKWDSDRSRETRDTIREEVSKLIRSRKTPEAAEGEEGEGK